jgi:hypothetical protein
MTKLSPEAQALLDAGRDALSPTAATKAGVLRSIDASLATGTAVAGSGAFAMGKLWLALTLIAGIGGGLFLFQQSDPVSKATVVPAVSPVVAVAPAVEIAEEPTPDEAVEAIASAPIAPPNDDAPEVVDAPELKVAPTKPGARRPAKPSKPQPTAAAPNDLLAERKLIASAQRAIRSKNYSEAKTLLGQHEQNFPKGVLVQERQAAQAIANCLEPSGTNGKAIARRFLERHASSPLAPRVRSICELQK